MLRLAEEPFTQGRSRFSDHGPVVGELTAKVYIPVQFGQSRPLLAQLDTGAAWSVLDPLVAQDLGSSLDWMKPVIMATRFGNLSGFLGRTPITFPADEGVPLTVVGTFFVSEHWPSGLTFLGYSGLLDAMRFALDPQANDFYFGLPW
ncbi:MAG TPA: hypothetical protein VFR31_16200 [Thermoanaerobaculia bacterium]|nr:hypothetical protein [Thermoanaerobaculia bacterium]